ncbi:MAG: glycosyltransferase family 39 protein [Thermodesulfobacteriota bacterium]
MSGWIGLRTPGPKSLMRACCIFIAAVLIRGLFFLGALQHPSAVQQPDSGIYITLAENLLVSGGLYASGKPVPTYLVRTPGYPIFLAAVLWITGGGLMGVVLVQVLLDSASCVLISRLGERVWQGTGLIAGLLAVLNPGMIAYSHFVLSDSLFLLLFLIALIGTIRFLVKPTWGTALGIGVALGSAAYVRSTVVYLPILLFFLFLICLRVRHREDWRRAIEKTLLVIAVFILCLLPWLVRNHEEHGRFSLSAQAGEHLLQYIVPFVWQHSKEVDFLDGMKRTGEEFRERAKKEGLDTSHANPLDVDALQVKMAVEYLRQEPVSAFLKAWAVGALKNLFAPALVDMSGLMGIERPRFFSVEGRTTPEKVWNFVRSIQGTFGWVVIGSMIWLLAARAVDLWGLVMVMRERLWEGALMCLVILYYLVISGPVGYAKYRLPIEPILIVLLAIGIRDLYGRWMRKGGGDASEKPRAAEGK